MVKELLKSRNITRRLLSIINTVLLKLYPRFVQTKAVAVKDLLEKNLWPVILVVFGMYIATFIRTYVCVLIYIKICYFSY